MDKSQEDMRSRYVDALSTMKAHLLEHVKRTDAHAALTLKSELHRLSRALCSQCCAKLRLAMQRPHPDDTDDTDDTDTNSTDAMNVSTPQTPQTRIRCSPPFCGSRTC